MSFFDSLKWLLKVSQSNHFFIGRVCELITDEIVQQKIAIRKIRNYLDLNVFHGVLLDLIDDIQD